MKMTMVGPSEVGKTAWLVSAYGSLRYRGICATASWRECEMFLDSDNSLDRSYRAMVERGAYPDATVRKNTYWLSLMLGRRPAIGFNIVDIRGGSIKSGGIDYDEVRREVSDSDVLAVFFPCDMILSNDPRTIERFCSDMSAVLSVMNQRISGWKPFRVHIVFTKRDLITDPGERRILEIFNGMLSGSRVPVRYSFTSCEDGGTSTSVSLLSMIAPCILEDVQRNMTLLNRMRKTRKALKVMFNWLYANTCDYQWIQMRDML